MKIGKSTKRGWRIANGKENDGRNVNHWGEIIGTNNLKIWSVGWKGGSFKGGGCIRPKRGTKTKDEEGHGWGVEQGVLAPESHRSKNSGRLRGSLGLLSNTQQKHACSGSRLHKRTMPQKWGALSVNPGGEKMEGNRGVGVGN